MDHDVIQYSANRARHPDTGLISSNQSPGRVIARMLVDDMGYGPFDSIIFWRPNATHDNYSSRWRHIGTASADPEVVRFVRYAQAYLPVHRKGEIGYVPERDDR